MSDKINSPNAFDIYVHWISPNGDITQGTVHSSLVYDGVVPLKGDILAIKWNEDDGEVTHDAWEVVERYNVDNDKGIFWHIILKMTELPPGRAEALELINAPTASDIEQRDDNFPPRLMIRYLAGQ